MIYRGILAVARDEGLRAFARHHLQTEAQHLELIEAVVPHVGRSRLLPLWRMAGWLTGALPACFGAKTVYATIESVETFVDHHYADQLSLIDTLLSDQPTSATGETQGLERALLALRDLLATCQQDEQAHRDDARERQLATHEPPISQSQESLMSRGQRGKAAVQGFGLASTLRGAWTHIVASGSASAVRVSRWI